MAAGAVAERDDAVEVEGLLELGERVDRARDVLEGRGVPPAPAQAAVLHVAGRPAAGDEVGAERAHEAEVVPGPPEAAVQDDDHAEGLVARRGELELGELVGMLSEDDARQTLIVSRPAYHHRRMPSDPPDRIRTLLLRADNVLKNTVPGGDEADRRQRARAALEEAAGIADDPAVDERVRGLIARRLEGLDELAAG